MTASEKLIEASFAEYLTAGSATLMILYPRMRAAGFVGKAPAWVQVAKAPFDVAGYYHRTARFIACEIKENKDSHTSLKIIAPEKKGTGLQYHQLEALVAVHNNGGLACVVWDNGGEWGFLDGVRLKHAKTAMDASLKAEKNGYPNASRGSRSILWGNFAPIKFTYGPRTRKGVPLWLPEEKAAVEPATPAAGQPEQEVQPLPPDDLPLDGGEDYTEAYDEAEDSCSEHTQVYWSLNRRNRGSGYQPPFLRPSFGR